MNKVVREHYPAARLPEDLRRGFGDGVEVRVVIEPQPGPSERDLPLTRILEEMQEHRVVADDPVTRVRALRAEWEWREERQDRMRAGDTD